MNNQSHHKQAIDRLNTAKLKHEVMSELDQLIRAPLMALLGKIDMIEKEVRDKLPEDKQVYFDDVDDATEQLLMTLKVLSDARG